MLFLYLEIHYYFFYQLCIAFSISCFTQAVATVKQSLEHIQCIYNPVRIVWRPHWCNSAFLRTSVAFPSSLDSFRMFSRYCNGITVDSHTRLQWRHQFAERLFPDSCAWTMIPENSLYARSGCSCRHQPASCDTYLVFKSHVSWNFKYVIKSLV